MAENLRRHTGELERNVNERTMNLQEKIEELEEFKRLVVGRELRMIELKKQVHTLKEQNNMGERNQFD